MRPSSLSVRHFLGAAVATASLLVAAGPASAEVLPGTFPSEISVDLPLGDREGVRVAGLCYAPCPITATVPSQKEDGSPYVVEPSGTWGASMEDGADVTFGPASSTLSTTLTTLGIWEISQTDEGSPETPVYDEDGNYVSTTPGRQGYSASSPRFLVLAPSDRPAPVTLLSSRKGLRVGSIVRVKSSKSSLAVALLFRNGGQGALRPLKCKKRVAGVRCLKITRPNGVRYPAKATLAAKGWNNNSIAYKLDDVLYGDNVEDTTRVKVSFRCRRGICG